MPLVVELLRDQAPAFSTLPLNLVAEGWDNYVFRIGESHCLRLPRRAVAVPLLQHEAEWLPQLASRFHVPVPSPIVVGRPSGAFPWPWTLSRWLLGQPMNVPSPDSVAGVVGDLAEFLAALHTVAPPNALRNQFRGGSLQPRNASTLERVHAWAHQFDPDRARTVWEQALGAAPWKGSPVWLHGDLHPGNLLQERGRLSGVIDFGDITSGDPATDLMVAWYLFDQEGRDQFRRIADTPERPIDDETWARAKGWALTHAYAILHASSDEAHMQKMAKSALGRILD